MRLALLCLLVPTAAHAAPSPTETFVTKLSQLGCPTRISQLEPVLGKYSYVPSRNATRPIKYPIGDLAKLGVRGVRVSLAFDIYHQDPATVKDPSVDQLNITLDGNPMLDAAIHALPGATNYISGYDTIWHAGNLYYKRGLLTVDCHTPDWARQPWTDADAKALNARVIDTLDHKTPSGMKPDAKEPGKTSSDDDRHELGIYKDWWYVHFKTPMPAAQLLKAIGVTTVTLRSGDVHMSHWSLHNADGSPLIYKGYRLDIDVVEDGLEKSNQSKPIDGTKLLITTINAHVK